MSPPSLNGPDGWWYQKSGFRPWKFEQKQFCSGKLEGAGPKLTSGTDRSQVEGVDQLEDIGVSLEAMESGLDVKQAGGAPT